MTLPELPRRNKKKEADFGTAVFKPWIHKNADSLHSGTFELKITESNSLPFSDLDDMQGDASLSVKWSKKGYLIRNQKGTIGAPDYSFYRGAPAFIVIKYPKLWVIVDIETFLEEKKRSQRKSLTSERACDIAWKVIK